ncbi:MAG: hypothetical protein CM1200mP34_3460 [Verrucomicrobiales bacterium]|nr:MAG: hypothetical protein CM1200mP34_3460 [Verrucomicrobiales bacterium]
MSLINSLRLTNSRKVGGPGMHLRGVIQLEPVALRLGAGLRSSADCSVRLSRLVGVVFWSCDVT